MRTRPSYSEIEPLLAAREVDKEQDTVHCVFSCPVTRRRVEASAHIRQGDGFKDRLIDGAARSFWYTLRRSVAQKVCSFLPHGFLRDVAEGTAWHMSYGSNDGVKTSSELQAATIDAFLNVEREFQYDGTKWTAREVADEFVTDFERQLKAAPVTTRYEGEILARCLAAMADLGGLEPSERDFLASFTPEHGSGRNTPPSVVELTELSDAVKPTVYMLASALSLVDEQQAAPEQAYLEGLEHSLGLDPGQARNLRRAAGQFIVEQLLGLQTEPDAQDINKLAQLAQLSADDVERVLVRRRKRLS